MDMIHICPEMIHALDQAHKAALLKEVPVGAVVIKEKRIIAAAGNRVITHGDPTAHAEILALRQAANVLGDVHLTGCDLYVTLEPCAMCAQAISLARINRLYFGAYDPKSGGVEHGSRVFHHPTCHHKPHVYGGIHEQECAQLLRNFFTVLR